MDYKYLSEILFPDVTMTEEDLEARFPPRDLPEGAKVTRFAPSPTGYVHFGGLFPATVGERLAHQSGGVFYLRIEDTDARREVEGAAEALKVTLANYGIFFDEGEIAGGDLGEESFSVGAYGPYRQSKRADIYHVYAKRLVADGRAYPVFSTDEELDELKSVDKKAEIKSVDWEADGAARREAMLARRNFTIDEVERELAAGHKFALFAIASGDGERRVKVNDLVRGDLDLPENDEDVVLLKSDGIPTYHFAHVVDDHLMRTTHVIRGEEWLPSLPKHLQLFSYLGWRAPKYIHISQLMKLDENGSKKKLSKRDMGANLDDYRKLGYCPQAVTEYVMTLLNSNYEEWRAQNPDKPYTDFPFNIKKMSSSGCLFDMNKLNDVTKNVVSRMTADEVFAEFDAWAREYDPEFYGIFAEGHDWNDDESRIKWERSVDYALSIINIGRGGKKPRKDYGTWVELRNYMAPFYDETFRVEDEYPENVDKADIKAALSMFAETYSTDDDSNAWFEKIKAICEPLGYCPDMKQYRSAPDQYRGSVADISMMIRVAVTGRLNSPDLYTVMHILGETRVLNRIRDMINKL